MFLFGAEQSASNGNSKIDNLSFSLGCRYVTHVQLMVTVKSEISFDNSQVVGGAKNLQDQFAVVIYPPKVCQYDKLC